LGMYGGGARMTMADSAVNLRYRTDGVAVSWRCACGEVGRAPRNCPYPDDLLRTLAITIGFCGCKGVGVRSGGDATVTQGGRTLSVVAVAILLAILILQSLQGSTGFSRRLAPAYTTHAPILIASDADFTPANGVVGGTGT